jgi:glycosidase
MQWTGDPGAGFTEDDVVPWLPLGDAAGRNVAAQREDVTSVLHLVRDLIALRREAPDVRAGDYASLPSPAGAWAYRRGESCAVALNLSDAPVEIEGVEGLVVISTTRAHDEARVGPSFTLEPWTGVVVATS